MAFVQLFLPGDRFSVERNINVDCVAMEGLTDVLLQHAPSLALGYQDMQ